MITQETLIGCLEQCRLFWKTGDVDYLHRMNDILETCIPGDEYEHARDIAYEVTHICVRCKLDVAQVTEMLVIAKIDVEVMNNG